MFWRLPASVALNQRHSCSLHGTSFIAVPSSSQFFPPLDGGGLVQVLANVLLPGPHVLLHGEIVHLV